MKYNYNTFKELFDSEIHYAYEPQYGCYICEEEYGMGKRQEVATFNKLYLNSNGEGQYKTNNFTFDPRLWQKVKRFCGLLEETTAEKILFTTKRD